MSEKESNLPDQKDLEKEIGEYLYEKYGERVKIVSTGILPQVAGEKTDPEKKEEKKFPFQFDLKPEELVSYLDEYIIKQDQAKAVLATKICTHFNRILYLYEQQRQQTNFVGHIKNNVLLIGPTGVGKTYLVKLIAQRIGVPIVKGDATKFSETGYVGGDVDDLVRDLVREADGDIELAQYGIIYVDEIDKIAHSQSRLGLDVSRSGVQRALLKPMEETEVDLKVPHDMISQIEAMEHFRSTGKREKRIVNTKNILFIMSGAFDGLEEHVSNRLHQQTIGFEGDLVSTKKSLKYLRKVKAEDLVQFGFESEFIGRLPVTALLDELTVDDLEEILLNPNCAVINAKKLDFMVYGIKLDFEKGALREIAILAQQEKTGARGLVSVIERKLLPFEKKLPSTSINYLTISVDIVLNPEKALRLLLENEKVEQQHKERYLLLRKSQIVELVEYFEERKESYFQALGINFSVQMLDMMAAMICDQVIEPDTIYKEFVDLFNHVLAWQEIFSEQSKISIIFNQDAIDHILSQQPPTINNIDSICENMLKSMEYGLKLLEQKKHVKEIVITTEGVDEPEKFINDFVEQIYKL